MLRFAWIALCAPIAYCQLQITDHRNCLTYGDQSGDLPDFGSVLSYQISPDGKTVVYKADVKVDSMYDLFSVPILGWEAPVPLNPSLVNGGTIDEFSITPNILAVVYRGDIHLNEKFELYAVPIRSGEEVRLDAERIFFRRENFL